MLEGGAAVGPGSGPTAGQPSPEAVDEVTKLMRCGRAGDAERALRRAAGKHGDAGRRAVIQAILDEPQLNRSLTELERWLDGVQDLKAAAPIATWWALPAAGIENFPDRVQDIRKFIDRYPKEGRKIHILQSHAADWVVSLLGDYMDPAPHMPAIRSAITMLIEMTSTRFPDCSKNFTAVLDYDDEKLWWALADMLVRLQIVVD